VSLYLTTFLAGLAGSMHCIGMCGGFACLVGTGRGGVAAALYRQLAYSLGRVTTYAFLGAVLGLLGGSLLQGLALPAAAFQTGLAVFAGAVMVWVGLDFLGVAGRLRLPGQPLGQALVRPLGSLLRSPHPGAPLALGVANGLLPCPLVYAFAAQALAGAAPLRGAGIMIALGLGTLPAMLFTAATANRLSQRGRQEAPVAFPPTGGAGVRWRLQGVRVAGGLILLLGAVTALRGTLPFTTGGAT